MNPLSRNSEVVVDLNTISDYLAERTLPDLKQETLMNQGIESIDLVILFGGAIPAAADILGKLWQAGLVKKMMLVGGIGHTTDHLRTTFQSELTNQPEARLFADYLIKTYGIPAEELLLEVLSTNCGENVQFALDILLKSGYVPKETLIMQDSSMQRRMGAAFKKIWPKAVTRLISYAPYKPIFSLSNDELTLGPTIRGIWEPRRYIELILGEIPRLRDNSDGYGPKGKDYIAHVEIPETVQMAFERVASQFPDLIRKAYSAHEKDD